MAAPAIADPIEVVPPPIDEGLYEVVHGVNGQRVELPPRSAYASWIACRMAYRPERFAEINSLTFYIDNAESYGKRVDDQLTLFLSVKSEELVGCQVKGIRKNLRRLGQFGIAIKHGKVRLDLFFYLLALLAEKPQQRQKYPDLSQRIKHVEVEFDEKLVGA